jgi:hypothetical protein
MASATDRAVFVYRTRGCSQLNIRHLVLGLLNCPAWFPGLCPQTHVLLFRQELIAGGIQWLTKSGSELSVGTFVSPELL